MRHPASSTIAFDEVDKILRDALNRAKEAHCRSRKDAWIASILPIGGVSPIESSPDVLPASRKELAMAAERYSDFLLYGRIPGDLKVKESARRAGE